MLSKQVADYKLWCSKYEREKTFLVLYDFYITSSAFWLTGWVRLFCLSHLRCQYFDGNCNKNFVIIIIHAATIPKCNIFERKLKKLSGLWDAKWFLIKQRHKTNRPPICNETLFIKTFKTCLRLVENRTTVLRLRLVKTIVHLVFSKSLNIFLNLIDMWHCGVEILHLVYFVK